MLKKMIAAALALLLLAGCGPKVEPFESAKPREEISLPTPGVVAPTEAPSSGLPVIEAVDLEGLALDTARRNGIQVSFPKDDWLYDEGMGTLLSVYGAHFSSFDEMYNINVQKVAVPQSTIDQKLLDVVISELSMLGSYYTILNSGIYELRGEPVILVDYRIQFTDECIDMMIDMGAMTEEEIEAMGGREVLKSIPPTTQLMIYQSAEGSIYQYLGTFYNEEQKQMVLDCMTVLAATIETY